MGSFFKKALSFAAPIIGGAIGGPAGAAIGGAVAGGIGGGGIKGALIGGATGYAGNALGNSISSYLSKGLGSVGQASLGSTFSKNAMGPYSFGSFGGTTGNLANALANTTVSKALGGFAGNHIAGGLASSFMGPEVPKEPKAPKIEPFKATRAAQLSLPGSLQNLSTLDDAQQSSNIANQGVYGGGNGPDEQAYFTNLVNRRLVDDAGNVDQDFSDLNPIDQSYLSNIGLGGYSNPQSLLEAISKWKAA